MNTQDIQNVGAASEAAVVVAKNNEATFAEKATVIATKAVFGTITVACTVSAVACATYRVVRLVRLIRGDEK